MSSSVRVYYKQASTAVVHMGTKIFLGFQCNNFDTNDSDMIFILLQRRFDALFQCNNLNILNILPKEWGGGNAPKRETTRLDLIQFGRKLI